MGMLMEERRGPKSKFYSDEHDSARLIVFRLDIIRKLIQKYEDGLEKNSRNVKVAEIYDTLKRGQEFLEKHETEVKGFTKDFNNTLFGGRMEGYRSYYNVKHGELGWALKVVW